MPRIRSIHPSLFTDERWVECSALARMLYIGLLTEADDHGLFEWKPLQIKMRVLPADMSDVALLLNELRDVDLIAEFHQDGKRLGAIRRFCRHQKPRRPTYQWPLPAELAAYVCADDGSAELEAGPFPPKSGIADHKEQEEEQEREEEKEKIPAADARETSTVLPFPAQAPSNDWPDDWMADLCSHGRGWLDPHKNGRLITGASVPAQWKLNGFSYVLDVVPAIQHICAKRRAHIGGWEYFHDRVRENYALRARIAAPVTSADLRPGNGDHRDDKLARKDASLVRAFAAADRAHSRSPNAAGGGSGSD